ncbi:hypothetical protein [Clostridium butyricum]
MNNTVREITESSLHKEIDLIENIIERMADNAFKARGWYVTLLVALVSLTKDNLPFAIGCVPIISIPFWGLTAFFLCTERNYRKLYDHIISLRQTGDYSNMYRLNLDLYKGDLEYEKIYNNLLRPTIWPFYLLPIIAAVIFIFLNYPLFYPYIFK